MYIENNKQAGKISKQARSGARPSGTVVGQPVKLSTTEKKNKKNAAAVRPGDEDEQQPSIFRSTVASSCTQI